MPIFSAGNKIKDIFFGNQKIKEVYFGSQKVYSSKSETYAVFAVGNLGGVVNAYDKDLVQTVPVPFSTPRYRISRGDGATTVGNFAVFAPLFPSSFSGSVVNAYDNNLVRSIPTNLSNIAEETAIAGSVGNFAIYLFGGDPNTGNAYDSNLVRTIIDASGMPGGATFRDTPNGSATIGNFAVFVTNQNNNNNQGPILAYNANLVKTIGVQVANNFSVRPNGVNNANFAVFVLGHFQSGAGNARLVDAFNSNLVRTVATNTTADARTGAAARIGNYALFSLGAGNSVVNAYNDNLVLTVAPDLRATSVFSGLGTSIGNFAIFGIGRQGSKKRNFVDTYDVNLVRGAAPNFSALAESGNATTV